MLVGSERPESVHRPRAPPSTQRAVLCRLLLQVSLRLRVLAPRPSAAKGESRSLLRCRSWTPTTEWGEDTFSERLS